MKTVILAGGLGSRLSEETYLKPKPLVEIGDKPILWHIMKYYSSFGLNDFIICLGYKGNMIKEYFDNYFKYSNDIKYSNNGSLNIIDNKTENWNITLIDTGKDTLTGGRLKRVIKYINDDNFCFTYGDGLSNVNLKKLIDFHNSHGKLATVTAVKPKPRFGALEIKDNTVKSFSEKPITEGGWINGGFFVLNKKVVEFISSDQTSWEIEPMQKLSKKNELKAFMHEGFWQPMDTLREKNELEYIWHSNKAPWKIWKK